MDMTNDPLTAIILAGGKGTRLRSVIPDRPKPLAPVVGRPFVEWLVLRLRAQGVQRVVFSTGHLAEHLRAHFGDGAALGLTITYSHEAEPLGTGGGARLALNHAAGPRVLVLNGDSYCPFDLEALTAAHMAAGAAATLWLAEVEDSNRYGAVEVTPDGRVLAFREKAPEPRAGLINAGIYLFERAVLAAWPAGQALSLEQDIFPALAGSGLRAVAGPGPFLDIGTPEAYRAAEAYLHEELRRLEP